MHALRFLPAALMLATLVAGCAKVQARTEPVLPELVPPPPPTRMVETYVEEPLQTVTPSPADTALSQPPVRTTTKPAAQRADAVKPEPIRTEPDPEPERPASPPPSLTLQPAPGSESKTESSIRALLLQAGRDLGRVNYASLSTDGKAQYDMARRLMEQSEEAQRKGNLVFAGKLADKAATMAAVLVR